MIPKVERILKLAAMGFNTPVMWYTPPVRNFFSRKEGRQYHKWLEEKNKQSFVNIRTYKLEEGKESWLSKHHTFVPNEAADHILDDCLKQGFHCMTDLENPNNGLYAGNVMFEGDTTIVEYCYKPEGGAMVRDANESITIADVGFSSSTLLKLPIHLRHVIALFKESFSLPYKSVIIEFGVGLNPWGIRQEPIIFWEYRDLRR